jgi:hypothetical protein
MDWRCALSLLLAVTTSISAAETVQAASPDQLAAAAQAGACPVDLNTYDILNANSCNPAQSQSKACDQKYPSGSKQWHECYQVIFQCYRKVDDDNNKIYAYNNLIYRCRSLRDTKDAAQSKATAEASRYAKPDNQGTDLSRALQMRLGSMLYKNQTLSTREANKRDKLEHERKLAEEAIRDKRRRDEARKQAAAEARNQRLHEEAMERLRKQRDTDRLAQERQFEQIQRQRREQQEFQEAFDTMMGVFGAVATQRQNSGSPPPRPPRSYNGGGGGRPIDCGSGPGACALK